MRLMHFRTSEANVSRWNRDEGEHCETIRNNCESVGVSNGDLHACVEGRLFISFVAFTAFLFLFGYDSIVFLPSASLT